MNLQNGYTVLNEKITDGERTFIAKGPEVADKEIGPFTIGEFKLVYEKDGQIYGSTTGIPTTDDTCFDAFDAIFIKDETTEEDSKVETPDDPKDPENNTDPSDPEDGTDSTDSENGTDPVDPVDPEDSTDPVDPENPEDNKDAGENEGDDEVVEEDESSEN